MSDSIKSAVSGTRVIISFGAASGGMEFVNQLRRDIYRERCGGKTPESDPQCVYLDAYSLEGLAGSKIINATAQIELWDRRMAEVVLDFGRFVNPHWRLYFMYAMYHSKTMIFLLSKHWLLSPFCWEEFEMYKQFVEDGVQIRPIALVFPDALPFMTDTNFIDRAKNHRDVTELTSVFAKQPGYFRLDTTQAAPIGNEVILPGGEKWHYQYDYSISMIERQKLLLNVKVD